MYFSDKNNFFHGICFHHFHDDNFHKKTPGSINRDQFYKLIKFIGRENILDADQFLNRLKENKLTEKNLCFTFDDSLRSQYDIALPVLEDLKIKSFFFVYSSIFENKPDLLELYRYFRINCFSKVDEFYNLFFKKLNIDLLNFFKKNEKKIKDKKISNPFYSINDIKFRLIRDQLLTKKNYQEIMSKMFKEKNFNPNDHYESLFLNTEHLVKIKKLGHIIGLHSHSHPVQLEKLSFEEQTQEYNNSITIISKILNCDKKEIKSMSHPCGSYNQDTLKVLKNLNIELGFKEVMTIDSEKKMKKINNSCLEIARENHANIMAMMN